MGGQSQLVCNTEERKTNCMCTHPDEQLCACTCVCTCVHISFTKYPTHSPAWPAPGGCTEAVEGEVLHNHVDSLTSRGHNITSTALARCECIYNYTVQAMCKEGSGVEGV